MEDQMTIRRMTSEHLEQYNDLLRYAFQVTEKTLLEYGWENDDIRQSKYPVLTRAHVLGCFDGDRLASQFAVYPLQMNVHGHITSIGFVTSVATYPEYSGMGLMSRLMKQSLCEMRARGQTLSLLYPYSIPLYRHRGWELISDKMTFRLSDRQLPRDLEVPGKVQRVDDDNPDLLSLHNRFALKTHGCILRNELAWGEYWRWEEDDATSAVYYDAEGVPCGYMVYMLRDDTMHVKEMIYLHTEAWKGLWKFIAAHESMVDEVLGENYTNEPIAFWLPDSDIKETIRPYIMGRIIDVLPFLGQYRFLPAPGRALSLRIVDDFLEWNNVECTVRFSMEGHPEILEGAGEDPVTLDIGTLTTLLLGYKRPGTLRRMERLSISDEALDLLDDILPKERAYISDYI